MERLRVYADFHNADEHGRLRLDGPGAHEDLARLGLPDEGFLHGTSGGQSATELLADLERGAAK
jgi:hypothetical protein